MKQAEVSYFLCEGSWKVALVYQVGELCISGWHTSPNTWEQEMTKQCGKVLWMKEKTKVNSDFNKFSPDIAMLAYTSVFWCVGIDCEVKKF